MVYLQDTDTARHEAGHAVMELRYLPTIGPASIIPDQHSLGRVFGGDERLTPEAARINVLSLLGSWAALAALGSPDAEQGCESDFEQASEALALWKLDGTLDQWKKKALRIMRRSRNRRAVEAVADKLLIHRWLSGAQVDLIVMRSDGKITEAEFAHRWERLIADLDQGRGPLDA